MNETGRTIPPTPRKLREARARGEVPRSRDLCAAAGWIAGCAALSWSLSGAGKALEAFTRNAFGACSAPSGPAPGAWVASTFGVLAQLTVPTLLASWAAVLVAGVLYSGPVASFQAVAPRLDRLDPIAGLRRLFSGDRWIGHLRDAVKLAVLLCIGAVALRSAVRPALAAVGAEPSTGLSVLRVTALHLATLAGAAAGAFALLDTIWSRHVWMSKLRMTPEELKREVRETEGDPAIKAQRRRMHRQISEHRMLQDVRTAIVVLANPTHFAVALRWDEETMDAPLVVASGREDLARRIVRAARRAGVPVVHDAGLARSLSDLAPGETIPEPLFEAVAAVIRVLQED